MAGAADSGGPLTLPELEARAHALAARMPELLVEARRVAHTVTHGSHGRRRAGPGETFWQFRHFEGGEPAGSIDWRRSASSQHLFVREREWEAAHTVWLWVDVSASMHFQSHLSSRSKAERAIVLTMAVAELLARGGERVGLIGGPVWTNQTAMRRIAERIVQALREGRDDAGLPPRAALSRFAECVLIGDFLDPLEELAPRLESIGRQGVRGHLVQVLDPAEESLPYAGRTEFAASEGEDRMIAGRAETLRDRYKHRLSAHRQALSDVLRRLEWSLLVHHTDRPPGESLLTLHTRLAGPASDYRYRAGGPQPAAASRGGMLPK